MVAVACRALTSAALWNGHAPQVTTGVASASATHCQSVNWIAGVMVRTNTGTLSTALAIRRRRSAFSAGSRSSAAAACSPGGAGGAAGPGGPGGMGGAAGPGGPDADADDEEYVDADFEDVDEDDEE